jgi:hypothetical protein
LDRRGCEKSFLFNRIYFGPQMVNTFLQTLRFQKHVLFDVFWNWSTYANSC